MYVKNVTPQQLRDIGDEWDFLVHTYDEGHRVRFTLGNRSPRYHVVTSHFNGHERVYKKKVCFHGHYMFLEDLFSRHPDAIVDASWFKKVRYTADNFDDLANEVGDTVIRPIDQLRVRDRCGCE